METARDLFTTLVTVRSFFTYEVCDNEYGKAVEVNFDGRAQASDCFDCAIQALAPRCADCGCRIIGHGMEAGGTF